MLLTDARGVILNCVTAPSERKIFERAGLWLGADWSEACEGTNGIGTCLVERQALTIHQEEHFRGRHTGLTCCPQGIQESTAYHGPLGSQGSGTQYILTAANTTVDQYFNLVTHRLADRRQAGN